MVVCDYYLRNCCRFGESCWNEHPPKKVDLNNNKDETKMKNILETRLERVHEAKSYLDKLIVEYKAFQKERNEIKNEIDRLFSTSSFSNESIQNQEKSIFESPNNNVKLPTSYLASVKFEIGKFEKKPCSTVKKSNLSRYSYILPSREDFEILNNSQESSIESDTATEIFKGNLFDTKGSAEKVNFKKSIHVDL